MSPTLSPRSVREERAKPRESGTPNVTVFFPLSRDICFLSYVWSRTLQWISQEVSGLVMSGAVLFGIALATIPTICHAFVVLPSSSSFISERQVVLGSQHDFLSRGTIGAPIMAVSHAAAEEIENADEVCLNRSIC